MKSLSRALLLSAAALPVSALAQDGSPSNAELYEILEAQQERIEALEAEKQGAGGSDRLSVGGYGELHYNNVSGGDDEIDFHRFVLYLDYAFSERVKLVTEIELEHALAGDGAAGEIELEQAYLDFRINDRLSAKAGLFLIPVGILNETHEPPTFYGVERNSVENRILPTTWWEGGAALSGHGQSGLSWDLALHSGLNTPISGGNAFLIRSGRQKVSEAIANDPAVTGRLRYTGIPGLTLAGSAQWQRDITQGNDPDGVRAVLLKTHAQWQSGPFGLTALFANWSLSGDAPEALGRDRQWGAYLEGSWRAFTKVGFFSRYSLWDNEAGNSADSDWRRVDVGLNWWIIPDVVVKADIFRARQNASTEERGFNLGIGYQFGS